MSFRLPQKPIGRPIRRAAAVFLISAFALSLAVSPALAGTPQWTIMSVSRPTNLVPGDHTGEEAYLISVTNTGGASTDGSAITITDELPGALSLAPAGASGEDQLQVINKSAGATLTCVLRTCTFKGVVVPDDTLSIRVPVDVSATAPMACEEVAAGCVTNVVRVTGGGAPDAAVSTPTVISSTPAGFGISPGSAATTLSSNQAGDHPDLTTSIAFNTVTASGALAGDPKDTTDELPPGFAGDLVDTPACSPALFNKEECPIPAQIGVAALTFRGGIEGTHYYPVYNLTPNPGDVAKLGFLIGGQFGIQGEVTVRPGDYGLTTTFHNTNETLLELQTVSLTVWGVPQSPVHDPWRWQWFPSGSGELGHFGTPSTAVPAPFLSSPTACGAEPLLASFTSTSWQGGRASAAMPFGPLLGCDRLSIEPSLTAEATSAGAYSPTGLDLSTKIPQTYENPSGLSTSTLKKEVVTLPEGMTVNPSAGAGLAACTPQQLAEEETEFVAGRGCPNESKLATVRIVTPSLKEEVTGSVFLAQPAPFGEPGHNPFNSLLALYLIARIPNRGVLIKSPGLVAPNATTGQLTTTFDNLPPLPFSLAKFEFNQGANAPLVTPPTCGAFTVTAQLTPYSNPEGSPLTPLIPAFPITANCPSAGVPPFHPQVIAGTGNNSAGSYSPFYLRLIREDGEQELTGFSTIMPPGLTGNLTGIPFCADAAIEAARSRPGQQELAAPSCPAASKVGRTIAEAGVGTVLAQAPGTLYLAGPYHGAPFSLVSVTSAKVGPFDLGTVVIRFALRINPITAQVEVSPTGSEPIPHIIRGIVVHVRDIRAYVDRSGFIKNPTSCEHLQIQNQVQGANGGSASLASPFQAADCQNLAFKPSFNVTTTGKTSKANGASLHVMLTYPVAPQGSQANIRRVKVDLPKQLPSRLTTLQKACTAAQFDRNPAGCPAASFIGSARAITPILPVPLEGPAIFVSHGGEAFPSLEIVLQGYGVTVDLVGSTFISKQGVTSSTFAAVPDQPVTSFELTLPQGPNSALAANGNLCTSKLAMPTEFVGQNGMAIRGLSTPVSVTGCAKAKALTRAQQLARALKACNRKPKSRRAACRASARKRYGPVNTGRKSRKKTKR